MRMNVEGSNLDHTRIKAPYVRATDQKTGAYGDVIIKYDVRFKQSNKKHVDMLSLHLFEYLTAELIRNHADYIVDRSPMGCQTGFHLTVSNHENYEDILDVLEATMKDVLETTEVPASSETQCGWTTSHTLGGAQALVREFLAKHDEWSEVEIQFLKERRDEK